MRILQVSTSDDRGGAAMVAASLHSEFRNRGLDGSMAVGSKRGNDPDTFEIPNDSMREPWARTWNAAANLAVRAMTGVRGADRVARMMRDVGSPAAAFARFSGSENFDFPGTWRLLGLPGTAPDILQLHNLHGDYFDLRALPWLSASVPTAITLHDAWMLSGHCAHSFDCGRWETGCGSCPDLTIPPAIARDDTAANWKRKREIYSKSRLYVITPCEWLMRKVGQSMLSEAAVEKLVIPNGVDLSVFNPGARTEARARLGLSQDAKILLFAANGIRNNPWKDFRSLRHVVHSLAEGAREELIFLALGEEAPGERIGNATIRFVPFRGSRADVADHYRAADLYLHAAREDTFPNTILEALACGTPVVATGVGGIPEQLRSLGNAPGSIGSKENSGTAQATGVVVEPGDSEALTTATRYILDEAETRMLLGKNAAQDAVRRFSLTGQAHAYVNLYRRMLSDARQESESCSGPKSGKPA